jgi:ATP-dependent protease Clp ATPase subunit
MARRISAYNDKMHWCSYCGRDHSKVAFLLAGPAVFICEYCVFECAEIIIESTFAETKKLKCKTKGGK